MDEYGTVNDSQSFNRLLRYSPLHNIKEDINYPAMLWITGENDGRIPPFHSYKFVATLQNRPAQLNPVILQVADKAGHNGPLLYNDYFTQTTVIYGFLMN